MLIFNKISDRLHYYIDSIRVSKLKAKIEKFKFDTKENHIIVMYRLGRQKLLHKTNISRFQQKYFYNISYYDQHRLTKFSTLQYLLHNLFYDKFCDKETLINYIEEVAKQEELF